MISSIISKKDIPISFKLYLPTIVNLLTILFFPYDRIGVLKTVFCFLLLSFIFLVVIHNIAKTNNFVTAKWYFVLQVKIFVTLVCALVFFFLPLGANISTSVQDGRLIDATHYNYIARILAKDGLIANLDLAYEGWQTGGVTVVVGLIYTAFSSSTVTIIITNSFLVTLSALFCVVIAKNIITKNINHKWFYAFAFLPIEAFYDMSPSKEPFSLVLLYAIIYFLYLAYKKITITCILGLAISVGLLYMIRLNLLASLIGSFILYKAFYKISFKNILLVAGIAALTLSILFYSNSLDYLATAYLDLEGVNTQIENKDANEGLKAIIINTFAATSVFSLIAYLPIRAIVWLFLPFPFLLFSTKYISNLLSGIVFITDPFAWFHFFVDACSKFDSFLLILSFPFFIHFLLNMKSIIKTELGYFIVFLFVFLLLSLSTFSFIEGTRYRSVIEPAYFMLLLSSLQLKMKYINKIVAYVWYPAVTILVIAVWAIESFK